MSNIGRKFGHLNLVTSHKHFALALRSPNATDSTTTVGYLSFIRLMHPCKQIVLQKSRAKALSSKNRLRAGEDSESDGHVGVITHKQVAVNFEITWQPGPAVGNEPLLT